MFLQLLAHFVYGNIVARGLFADVRFDLFTRDFDLFALGVIFILFVRFLPGGLFGLLRRGPPR